MEPDHAGTNVSIARVTLEIALRLDDVRIAGGPLSAATRLEFFQLPAPSIQSGRQLPPFAVRAITDAGFIDPAVQGPVMLTWEGNGTLRGTVLREAVAGTAVFEGLTIDGAGARFFRLTAALQVGEP